MKKYGISTSMVFFNLLLCSLILFNSGKSVAAQDTASRKVQWELLIEKNPEMQTRAVRVEDSLRGQGVAVSDVNGKLTLSGEESLYQARTALFDTDPLIDFLGGPADLVITMPSNGQELTIKLQARLSAGYMWKVVSEDECSCTQSQEPSFAPLSKGVGAPSIQSIKLMPKSTGNIKVHLRYVRLFEPDTALHAQLNILLPESLDIIDLTDPTPKVSLIKEDANGADETEVDVYENLPENKGLPTSWDYRTRGIVPAVRDQGSCGGCWSFGTVGVMESAIKKAGGPLTDLSEQFLISCNNSGWDCDGGLAAHKYHYNTLSRNQTQIGAVLESAKPYTATNGTCSVTYNHPYRLSNWAFVSGSESTIPTVTQIKNAMYTYGPITARVCAGPAFEKYAGGVFSTEESATACNGSINHQIILVGWDDATQSWILRNSWGSSWGESGYMRIRWNTSRVGEGTSWVTKAPVVPPPPPPPPPPLPSSDFVSTFNSSKAGWVPHPGAPWSVNTAYYYTNGLANKWSSTTYNANFSNFTYEARMKRVNSASTYTVGLLVRGGLPSFDANNRWMNDYQFAYSNGGFFSVFKIIGGSASVMKNWTSSAAIVRGDWNTLKVVANGPTFKYYINNTLVWTGSDDSLKAGRVGVLQSGGPTPEMVYVDWARLSLSVADVNESIEKGQVEVDPSLPQDPRQSP